MKTNPFLLCLLVAIFLSGCVTGPLPQALDDQPLVRLAPLDESGLFAADSSGEHVAYASKGLALYDVGARSARKLSARVPDALAWSPDGEVLAAAHGVGDYETLLLLYSADGQVQHEFKVPVALTQLTWSARGDLLMTGFALKIYSFGGNLRQLLFRFDGQGMVESLLADTSLKPASVKRLAPHLKNLQPVVFTPLGDELAYLRLHDPPEFPPYFKLIYYNWQAASGRSLMDLPLQVVALDWDKSGDSLEIYLSESRQKLDLWPGAQAGAEGLAGAAYQFVDGRLSDDQGVLVDWGSDARFQILPGGRFLLAFHQALYLGSGLQDHAGEAYSEKKWMLRQWRYKGLITQSEYLHLLQENQ